MYYLPKCHTIPLQLLFFSSVSQESCNYFWSKWNIFNLSRHIVVSLRATQSESTSFSPPFSSSRWLSVLPLHCTWSAPYLSTGFKLAAGILSMNMEDRGQWRWWSTHTWTHKLLVSVHLSFDNKNTSLKLSSEHKTERKGNRIMLHAQGEHDWFKQ